MGDNMILKDMPKLQSPFEREVINNKYVCVPKFKEKFGWILDPERVIATEKFDGTNVSVSIIDGHISNILNRENIINIWKDKWWFYTGIKRAMEEKKFKPGMLTTGQYFGELIGGKINGNPYELDGALWLPFYYIQKHYSFKFYNVWLEDIKKFTEDTPKEEIDKYYFEKFSELFKNLKSLYFRQRKIEKAPEGIVFYNKDTGDMCKLRMDMFDWYAGKKHKWYENKR